MKRTPLLILCLLFLLLSVACLFYPDHSNRLHLALVVELVFLIQFAMVKKSRLAIKIPETIISSESLQQKKKHEADIAEVVVQEVNS